MGFENSVLLKRFVFIISGSKSAVYILTVQVSDINDVTPTCSSSIYSATVAEDISTGASVLQLTCSDTDYSSPNNDVSIYNIVSGNTSMSLFPVTNIRLVGFENKTKNFLNFTCIILDIM